MPYTPPKARSPVASQKSTPVLSRNQSYENPRTASSRPDLPRSRSAAYIQKHRRSPALGDANNAQQNSAENAKSSITFADGAATVASAQLPVHHGASRPSLADSYSQTPVDVGSSDEEDRGRSRQIAFLAETLKSNGSFMGNRRSMSPRKTEDGNVPIAPHQTPAILAIDTSRPGLTAEARKISHSRSSSEMIPLSQNQMLSVDSIFSPGDSDDEDGLVMMRRRPLLRKKSGELVKPALRPSRSSSQMRPVSAPGTPSYPKAVHFNENMEQVRHFLQVDRPSAVSADSSPVEMYESETDFPFTSEATRRQRPVVEWEIKTNFRVDSHERMCQPVRVEQIILSKDMKSLEGVVAVANISFEKWVTARFTFDYWKTTSEVGAEWSNVRYKSQNDGFDRFSFVIRLSEQAHLQNKTLFLCVRYNSAGQEHWDNNSGANYQVDFTRKLPQWTKPAASNANGIPRSRNAGKNPLTRTRSFPTNSSDDEFTTQYDSPFRAKNRMTSDWSRASQTVRDDQGPASPTSNRLASRYDFSTSLHGALMQAQTLLGDMSGVDENLNAKSSQPVSTAPIVATAAATAVPASASSTARPTLGSAEYKALIDKFCYFGSNGNSAIVSPAPEAQEPMGLGIVQTDGPEDSSAESKQSSANSSASNSPPSPKVQLHHPQPNSDSKSSTRTSSPSLRALTSPHLLPYRTPSPALSAYQEFAHQGLSVQSTKC